MTYSMEMEKRLVAMRQAKQAEREKRQLCGAIIALIGGGGAGFCGLVILGQMNVVVSGLASFLVALFGICMMWTADGGIGVIREESE